MAEVVTVERFRVFENHPEGNEGSFTEPGIESIVWIRGRIPDEKLPLADRGFSWGARLRVDTQLSGGKSGTLRS
jgi:hypothetical protein